MMKLQTKIELQKVDFSGGGDDITALYIDGELYKYGDYYHNKILFEIDGFIDGLKYVLGESGVNIKEEIFLEKEHPLIYSTTPPQNISDVLT